MTHRWTLDYEEDYEFFKVVLEYFHNKPDFSMKDVLELLKQKPEFAEINKKYAGVNWYRNVPNDLKTVERHLYKNTAPLVLTESLKMLERSKKVIPCATQTLSKGYTQWSVGASPLFLKSAKGCEVTDVDGNKYIDY